MARDKFGRRLIVNADDFGRSHPINQAIISAHQDGILTTTSLMVNGDAFEEAVELAKQNPKMGVGLHLTLVCGTSALSPGQIPGLVDPNQDFSDNPALAGIQYFFLPHLKKHLLKEIDAQFNKFSKTGLKMDHVNGHLNIHLHPTIFKILIQHADRWGIHHFRLTQEPFKMNLRMSQGRGLYRLSHAAIFRCLSSWAKPQLQKRSILFTSNVFGLLQTGFVDESYLMKLIPALPKGDSELYCHPCMLQARHELDALLSSKAKQLIKQLEIQLVRYQDL